MFNPRLVAFDLDDTLAPSKSALPPEMGKALRDLLDVRPVCVISGGQFAQFEHQLLANLDATDAQLLNLHLLPTCGTRYYRWRDSGWSALYAHDLSQAERDDAMTAAETEARRLGLWEDNTWGPAIEDRGSQITYSALGQNAPLEAKRAWDPHGHKKNLLRAALAERLPQLEVRSGGSTSVDITRCGIDKAYGMQQLQAETKIPLADMLFYGDRLDKQGNDYPVLALGVPCVAVVDWQDTAAKVNALVKQLCG